MKRTRIFLFLLSLSFCFILLGQAPQKIKYQAVARNTSGDLITGQTIAVKIEILEGSADGETLYTETHQATTNDYGLFTLTIGSGSTSDSFSGIAWGNGESKFIRIAIDTSGGSSYQAMGTSQLLSVPYALYAESVNEDMLNDKLNTVLNGDFSCGDVYTDIRDGKKYPTVQIGTQCWMAKNLNYGVMVSGNTPQTDNGTAEKYCYNNNASSCDTYGGLYQWNEMMDYTPVESTRGLCPEGWHVPSDGEWKALEIALGMDTATADLANTWRGSDEGTKLKAGGSSGYDALLSGRCVGGAFALKGSYEYPWTSTEYGSYAWRRCLRSGDATVGRWNTFPKSYGFSVRCVKDE